MLRRGVHLRGENAGRRRMRGGRPNSGEAAVVGGDDLFGMFSSGREALYRRKLPAPMRRGLAGDGVVPGSSPPGSECWPEEDAWWVAELRRSRGGRR